MADLEIRPMSRGEFDVGVEWAAQEGWNPGLHDADTFHATDPGGFLGGWLDGEPVAMVSAVRYGDGFGFLGFYLVRPEHRGRGHGIAVWHAAMERFGRRVVGLDGVVAQQDNYRRSGFRLAWNNVRHEGRVRGHAGVAVDPGVVPLAGLPVGDVVAYDRRHVPAGRRRFMERWIAQEGSVGVGLVRDGALAGMAVRRPCRTGWKIGPLFADDDAGASALFHAVVAPLADGETVQLDVPAPNAAGVALAASEGLAPVFETARMYTGPVEQVPIDRVFGVTTFELG